MTMDELVSATLTGGVGVLSVAAAIGLTAARGRR